MAWSPIGNLKGPQGIAGPPGSTGPQGPQGATGSTGSTGPQGPQGPKGDQGTAGTAGTAGAAGEKWFTGAGAPSGSLAGSVTGDWYLDSANGDYYEKTGASTWTLRGNLKGPQGNTGTTGTAGTPGEKWFSGSGAPPTGTGIVGDWFLRTDTGDYYEKTGTSTWTLRGNLTGPQGATGNTGSTGAGVPTGGTTGQSLIKQSGTNYDTAWKSFASLQTAQVNPAATSNTAGVMQGLAVGNTVTPTATGKVLVTIAGQISNATASKASFCQMRYGTGTPPAGGSTTLGGTVVGAMAGLFGSAASQSAPFSLSAVVTGLTLATAYWFDLQLWTQSAGSAFLTAVTITATEIP